MVVNLNAAPHSKARLFCQPGRRADADGHHHDVRRNFGAVLQPYRFHLPKDHADNLSSIAPVRIFWPRRSSSDFSSQPAASSS
jgi:hypothetical protein